MPSRRVLRDEDLRLNIILDGKQVPKENKKLMGELGKLEREGTKLENSYRRLAKEQRELIALEKRQSDPARVLRLQQIDIAMNNLTQSIKVNALAQKDMRQQIGLSGMTLNQLRTHLKLLQIEQSNMRGDEEMWTNLQEEIDKTNSHIKKLTTNSTWLGMLWDDISRKANKYGAAIGAIGLVVYQVASVIQKLTGDIKELEDAMAGVRRTTGLTREEVIGLKNSFDKMDTRTATNELLEIAKTAGRLGIEKEKINDFVEAFDKINVALGEDLVGNDGNIEDVAKAVGKLVQNFGMTKDMPFNEAILRAGSLLNELDKSSQASAAGILEFTTRLSGLAGSTSMTIDQVAGIGATLDALGLQSEMASTAIQRMLLNMGTNVGEYSKIMGVTAAEYKQMVNTDLNSAFITLIQKSMDSKQGITGLAESLKKLGIDEQRAILTLGMLSNNLDVLTTQQKIAKQAVSSSASVMEEFAIMNSNVSGEMDKTTKRIVSLRQGIGMELLPVMSDIYKVYADFLYLLRDAGIWIMNHIQLVKGMAIAYGAYRIALVASTISMKGWTSALLSVVKVLPDFIKRLTATRLVMIALEHGVNGLGRAMKVVFASIRANPLGIIITAIGIAVGLFVAFSKKVIDGAKALKEYKEGVAGIRKETSGMFTEEKAAMDALFDSLKRNLSNKEETKKIVNKLNAEYGAYVGYLDAEKLNLSEITKLQERANKNLEYEIAVKQKKAEIEKTISLSIEQQRTITNKFLDEVQKAKGAAAAGQALGDIMKIFSEDTSNLAERKSPSELAKEYGVAFDIALETITTIGDLRRLTDTQLNDINKYFDEYLQNLEKEKEINNAGGGTGGGGGNAGGITAAEKLTMLKNEYKARKVALMKQMNDQNLTQEWFDDKMLAAEFAYLQRKIAIMKEGSLEIAKEEGERGEKLIDIQEQYEGVRTKKREADRAKEIKLIEQLYAEQQAIIQRNFQAETEAEAAGGTKANKDKYDASMLILEIEKLRKLQKLYAEDKKELIDIDKELAEKNTELVNMQIEKTGELIDTTRTLKQARTEYKRELRDEMELMKEYESLFSKTIIGNIILWNKQHEMADKAHKDELAMYAEQQLVMDENHKNGFIKEEDYVKQSAELNSKKIGLEIAYAENVEKMEKERVATSVKIGLEHGEEFARMWAGRYAERLKQEQELKEQLQNGEITQAEYEKKVQEIRLRNQKAFFKDVLVMILKNLQATLNAAIAEIAIKNYSGNSGLGVKGMIKATLETAAMSAAVNGAFELAKAKLTSQYATGKYPVVGANDGRNYQAGYVGVPKTGIYNGPQLGLFNENPRMPEMVVDGMTTRKIMVNYPGIYRSILALANRRTPQYAEGKYPGQDNSGGQSNAQMQALMAEMLVYLKNPVQPRIDPYAIDESLKEIDSRKVRL
ncbi:MAG: phage tail tape measure protein [Dehalococcoidia bacterium]|nr:MAG: phage tail tape measure protein [Dehalococcoidia bacterium]